MATDDFVWTLVNFPKHLDDAQNKQLEKAKMALSKLCYEFDTIYATPFSVMIISSYPQQSNYIHFSLPVPLRTKLNIDKLIGQFQKDFLLQVRPYIEQLCIKEIKFCLGTPEELFFEKAKNGEALQLHPNDPLWRFDQLILSEKTLQSLGYAISLIENKRLIFDEWGLRKIQPRPAIMVNFHGPPGTGKTMAAHAIANRLKLGLLELSYAQIESKYVGDGPKNLRSVFELAIETNSVLFIDEADSLLGNRIKNVKDGAEQAINSMRSQMLLEMDRFEGIAIFATNLSTNYDIGFNSRLVHIEFQLPSSKERLALWDNFILESLPGKSSVNIDVLVELSEGLSGRDIRDSVILAATIIAQDHQVSRNLNDALIDAVQFHKKRSSS